MAKCKVARVIADSGIIVLFVVGVGVCYVWCGVGDMFNKMTRKKRERTVKQYSEGMCM
ncbi:MAG: hypothetical protein FWF97_03700 [Alphaproteobacteria bacterium]|nr:hypothetical protein [Alphaproteobacteria bacterium]